MNYKKTLKNLQLKVPKVFYNNLFNFLSIKAKKRKISEENKEKKYIIFVYIYYFHPLIYLITFYSTWNIADYLFILYTFRLQYDYFK